MEGPPDDTIKIECGFSIRRANCQPLSDRSTLTPTHTSKKEAHYADCTICVYAVSVNHRNRLRFRDRPDLKEAEDHYNPFLGGWEVVAMDDIQFQSIPTVDVGAHIDFYEDGLFYFYADVWTGAMSITVSVFGTYELTDQTYTLTVADEVLFSEADAEIHGTWTLDEPTLTLTDEASSTLVLKRIEYGDYHDDFGFED